MSLRNSVCSTRYEPIIGRCFGACNGTSCAEDDRNKKMRHLFGCPDIVSLTDTFLMARNFFQIFTENNPARGTGKKIICQSEGVNMYSEKKKKKLADDFQLQM